MQPLTVVIGIVLGSVFSIAFGLAIVCVIFGLRQGEDSRFAAELPELIQATVLFSVITVVSALAFLGSLRGTPWRHWALLVLVIGLSGIGYFYSPA